MSSKAAAKEKAKKKAHAKAQRHPVPKKHKKGKKSPYSDAARLITNKIAGGATVAASPAAEEPLPKTLAFSTEEIDYGGWETLSMVGIDGITDERRGRRGRRGLFAVLQNDRWKRQLVTLHIRDQYTAAEAEAGGITAAAEPGRFERILKFIYDHREEILAFIQRIVELFAGMPV